MTLRYTTAWQRLNAGAVLILDGGVSTELERRGVPMADGVWSARASLDSWESVVAMHRAYIDAGADVITTNTYAASRLMLEPAGLGDQLAQINRRAIDAAFEARERAGNRDVLVAGSMSHMIPIPPGGYRVSDDDNPDTTVMRRAFIELAKIHADAGVDLILLEMMSAPDRMRPMFDAVAAAGLPVWCGQSAMRDEHDSLRAWHDPTVSFADIVAMAASYDFDVMGVMHTRPDLIAEALGLMRQQYAGPLMAYPDSGYFEMPHWQFVDTIAPPDFAQFAHDWRDAGAQILGGCCGLGPEHIAAIATMKATG